MDAKNASSAAADSLIAITRLRAAMLTVGGDCFHCRQPEL
jgi:hypothetical protein